MKTPDEIKKDIFFEIDKLKENEIFDNCIQIAIDKAFSLGVEEGKKQIIDRIKCTYCPMCGLEWDNCNCDEVAFSVMWLKSKLQEDNNDISEWIGLFNNIFFSELFYFIYNRILYSIYNF